MTAETANALQDAIEACKEEDLVFAQTYIPEQSTRAALRTAIRAMRLALREMEKERHV